MLQWNPYWQQWEPVVLVVHEPAAPSPLDTFCQQFAGHLALVLATGVGAAVLKKLLD
jgi:hypothetical protein